MNSETMGEDMAKKTKHEAAPAEDTLRQAQDQAAEQTEAVESGRGQPLSEELLKAERKAEEYLQMAQRVQADFDNYRRRNRQVAADSFDDGARAFIKTILPVCDNLERALKEAPEGDALHEGVTLVQRQLADALAQRGVEPVSRLGEPFDPNLEHAVAQGGTDEGEPGTVCEVLVKGYRMGDHILRHAMVRVVGN
ncbi:MAG TPA: nucleotide exchange factor GrpE [Candidatus Limnocylindria bacterium]|nr:nucleotide exchange factor GrpE [Candidatus Limnocylindria bacterium]